VGSCYFPLSYRRYGESVGRRLKFFPPWIPWGLFTERDQDVSEDSEKLDNFPLSTCHVTCYIGEHNFRLGKLRSLAAK
jgi:hypothetical protein